MRRGSVSVDVDCFNVLPWLTPRTGAGHDYCVLFVDAAGVEACSTRLAVTHSGEAQPATQHRQVQSIPALHGEQTQGCACPWAVGEGATVMVGGSVQAAVSRQFRGG